MHIMFVCTGNICRSPMGELLMSRYRKHDGAGDQRWNSRSAHAPD